MQPEPQWTQEEINARVKQKETMYRFGVCDGNIHVLFDGKIVATASLEELIQVATSTYHQNLQQQIDSI